MSLELINKLDLLKDRAIMFARCRQFFALRAILEVDVPILSTQASVDVHIDLIQVNCCGKKSFLHSSPEYGMKRLLAEKVGDIYQMSHVFRDNEKGKYHTCEFMMVEWYRIGFSLQQMINETLQFIKIFLEMIPMEYEIFSYFEAFMRHVGRYPDSEEERDVLYGFEIEPHFGRDRLTVITDFPSSHAALAKVTPTGVAERFEIYYKGIELANGYHELTDPKEQYKRIISANYERQKLGKTSLPLDEDFIKALESGLPDCCGVAVGFDRLMMLRNNLEEIRDASSFFI